MALGDLRLRRRLPTPANREQQTDPMPAEETVGDRAKFNLESLEPRILLSGDPVLAELARVVETDNQTDSADQPAVIVEEIDAALQSDIGLAADNETPDKNASSLQSTSASVVWPVNWQTTETDVASRGEAEESLQMVSQPQSDIEAIPATSNADAESGGLLSTSNDKTGGDGKKLSGDAGEALGEADAEMSDESVSDEAAAPADEGADIPAMPVPGSAHTSNGASELRSKAHDKPTGLNLAIESAAAAADHSAAPVTLLHLQQSEVGQLGQIMSGHATGNDEPGKRLALGHAKAADDTGMIDSTDDGTDDQAANTNHGLAIGQLRNQAADPSGSNADVQDTNKLVLALIAANHRVQENNRLKRNESNKNSGKSANDGNGHATPSSLPMTESELPISEDINDESIARGPPVFDGIHTVIDYSQTDTVAGQATVLTHSSSDSSESRPDDTEFVPDPPADEAQPRAPPETDGSDADAVQTILLTALRQWSGAAMTDTVTDRLAGIAGIACRSCGTQDCFTQRS